MPRHPETVITPNTLLVQARQRLRSPRRPGQHMSRAELADAVNAALDRLHPGRHLTAHYVDHRWVGKLERGEHRWPSQERRAALRHILGATTDTELDLYNPRRTQSHTPVRNVSTTDTVKVPGLSAQINEIGINATFSTAASMLEMAGWVAHDSGDDAIAEDHFKRAPSFTRLSDDEHLRAQILGSMSHLSSHRGRPDRAIQLARRGQGAIRDVSPYPPLTARLLALEARGAAALGDSTQTLQLLSRAESELVIHGSTVQTPSSWLSQYDRASLASDAYRCLRRLGDLAGARSEAELIVDLRPTHRARSRALGLLALASTLAAQGTIARASSVIEQVLNSYLPAHSAPITHSLATLHDALAPRRSPLDAGVYIRLTAILEQRRSRPEGNLRAQDRPVT